MGASFPARYRATLDTVARNLKALTACSVRVEYRYDRMSKEDETATIIADSLPVWSWGLPGPLAQATATPSTAAASILRAKTGAVQAFVWRCGQSRDSLERLAALGLDTLDGFDDPAPPVHVEAIESTTAGAGARRARADRTHFTAVDRDAMFRALLSLQAATGHRMRIDYESGGCGSELAWFAAGQQEGNDAADAYARVGGIQILPGASGPEYRMCLPSAVGRAQGGISRNIFAMLRQTVPLLRGLTRA